MVKGKKFRIVLFLSLILNILLITAVGINIQKRGGLKYIKMALTGKLIKPGQHESNYYFMKISSFEVMSAESNKIVLFGNGLADYCDWGELLSNPDIVNRGIGGDNICGMVKRVGHISKMSPRKVFVMLDSKDCNLKTPINTITECYNRIIDTLLLGTPLSGIYCTSIIPVNVQIIHLKGIKEINKELEEIANRKGINYIDLSDIICDENFDIKKQYTFNGVYLNGEGFKAIAEVLNRHIKE